MSEYLFIYGTLRQGGAAKQRQLLIRYCEYVAEGFMPGRLYEIAGYPGAIESDLPNERIVGEVYRILEREPLLRQLDEYEECSDNYPEPREYTRKQLPVTLAGVGSLSAWVYLYNRDVSGLLRIASGDYLEFLGHGGS